MLFELCHYLAQDNQSTDEKMLFAQDFNGDVNSDNDVQYPQNWRVNEDDSMYIPKQSFSHIKDPDQPFLDDEEGL